MHNNGVFAGGVKDARGSTVGASIATGLSSSATVKFDYLAYGEVATDPANMDVSQVEWAGMQMDNRKLYYARNRYYSPQMGRFLSEDPIGLAGGVNAYMYCHGDPIGYTDPLGLADVSQVEWANMDGWADSSGCLRKPSHFASSRPVLLPMPHPHRLVSPVGGRGHLFNDLLQHGFHGSPNPIPKPDAFAPERHFRQPSQTG